MHSSNMAKGAGARNASITASESFAARAQRSEAHRVALWFVALAGMVVLTGVRRASHGLVMSSNALFIPYMMVLVVAMAAQVALWIVLRQANREGRLLSPWLWRASAAFDLFVPVALLTIAALYSPRGPVPALSAPPLLLLPLLILTSVLRLRPWFTLYTGLAAAAIHWALVVHAIKVAGSSSAEYPVYFAYGFVLLLTAVAGAFVARAVRAHVREAAEEASAHERAEHAMAAVQHDLAVARDIQAGLLPQQPPAIAGYEIAGMNRPADLTGGDYYDWQELPDGRLAVVLADVTGHGIGPALVMAVCRAYARASAPIISDPAILVGRLNDLLHADLPSDRFITFAIAILSPDGRVELLSAGHGPTLLYRAASGDIQQFGGDGLPLGIAPGEVYGPTSSFRMEQGDALMLLTDGFFEWQRPSDGECFGIERLCDAMIGSIRDGGLAAGMIRSIDAAVTKFADGAPQADDMTAVVVRRTAASIPADGRKVSVEVSVADDAAAAVAAAAASADS